MEYFLNFINSEDYFFYVISAYFITVLIVIILKIKSVSRNRNLEKVFKQASNRNEG